MPIISFDKRLNKGILGTKSDHMGDIRCLRGNGWGSSRSKRV